VVPVIAAKSQRYEIMDDKIEHRFEPRGARAHARQAFGGPEVVVVNDIEKLIDEIRMERKKRDG
jgi:hypothetical protein